jgi:hypothetical protein
LRLARYRRGLIQTPRGCNITVSGIKAATFSRFVEYVYYGQYDAEREHVVRGPATVNDVAELAQFDKTWPIQFDDATRANSIETADPQLVLASFQADEHSPVQFTLNHTDVYLFAILYRIDPLALYAYLRIRRYLIDQSDDVDLLNEFHKLVNLVYQKRSMRTLYYHVKVLRGGLATFLATFAADNFGSLCGRASFQKSMMENAAFAKQVMVAVSQKECATGSARSASRRGTMVCQSGGMRYKRGAEGRRVRQSGWPYE